MTKGEQENMKFAICNETFQDWPFAKAFAFARQCGYTGIEFAPFTINKNAYDITADRRREIRRQAEDAGLEVVGLHWLLAFTEGYYLTSPEAAVRRRTGEYLGELARLCRDLGGNVLVLGSPKQRNLLPGVTHDQALEYAADVLRSVVPTLDDCGVVLAAEPLGPEEGDFLRTAELGVRLVEMVGSPRCRLHLDVKAMSTEQKPIVEIIRDSARGSSIFTPTIPTAAVLAWARSTSGRSSPPCGRSTIKAGSRSKCSITRPASKCWPAIASNTCSSA